MSSPQPPFPIYYDRSIDDQLARTIHRNGPLAWLMDHVRSGDGALRRAHLQFRRDRSNRSLGSIQLYWGRTSPLEFRLRRRGQVRVHADATYQDLSEALFREPIAIRRLRKVESALRAHLERCWRLLADSPPRRRAFVAGEADCHAGLMRRYGHHWRSGDPLVLIDSEARIGFASEAERRADDAETRAQLQLDDAVPMPRKLDAVGVLPSGDLALVEVKDVDGSIDRAIVQAAAHQVRFSRLLTQGTLRDAVLAMVDQKAAAGLISHQCPRPAHAPRIVPCIAAPDASPDWADAWRHAFDQCGRELRAALQDLVFLRLDAHGRILERTPR